MSAQVPAPVVTTVPVAGGLEDGTYWTGGPRVTGKFLKSVSPFSFCPDGYEKSQKIFKYAVDPLTTKYNGSEKDRLSLHNFGEKVWKHLVMTGMDSVFYFIDQATGEERNIVEYYARFSCDEISAEVAVRKQNNAYDATNIFWSGEFLFNSISVEQQDDLAKYQLRDSNGPV
ncbi:MAG: hypothetical protein ACRDL7_14880, partial [Gaiellaceae bacterium]